MDESVNLPLFPQGPSYSGGRHLRQAAACTWGKGDSNTARRLLAATSLHLRLTMNTVAVRFAAV
eukprot:6190228-Pleurochrysis_carterae.AAC.1